MLHRRTLRSLNTLTARDASQLLFTTGCRNAIGVVIPLVIALITNHMLTGLTISVGALVAGFASLSGTARKRTRTMLLATTWMGVATFIGAMSGGVFWLVGMLIMTSGFVAGMMIAIGPEAGQVGLLSTNALILISNQSKDPIHSLLQAGCVVAGGLLQTVLMISMDLISIRCAESSTVSEVYSAISKYANEQTRGADLRVASSMLIAEASLNDSYMNRYSLHKLRTLLNAAEEIRIHVVALSRISKQLDKHLHKQQADAMKEILISVSEVLQQIAQSTKASRVIRTIPEYSLSPLHTQLEILEQETNQTTLQTVRSARAIYTAIKNLQNFLCQDFLNQLGGTPLPSKKLSVLTPIRKTYTTFIANCTFQSTTFRHAIRVAITLAVAMTLSHVLSLPHGYWLPLTTLLILKPDFTATFSRGIARMLGTGIGILIATLLIEVTGRSNPAGIILIVIFAAAMYTVVNFNYALFTCTVTGEIIVLLSFFEHSSPFEAMMARLMNTLIGSGLAIFAYILWPTWQHKGLHITLSDLIQKQRRYFHSLTTKFHEQEVQQTQTHRQAARLARTNAVSAVQQAMNEPVGRFWDPYAILGMLTALHRFSDILLSLEAYVMEVDNALPSDSIFCASVKYIDDALNVIGYVVRHPEMEMNAESIQRMIAHPETNLNYQSLNYIETTFARLEGIIQTMLRMVPFASPSLSED